MAKRQINILLVDDDAADQKLAKVALQSGSQTMAFSVQAAETLSQALGYLENNKFDLVLLDLGLPDSKGIATIEKIRESHKEIPIIVLTGLEDELVGIESIRKGATDYITKPFKESILRIRLGIALQITELQEKLLSLANTDELTGLPNRRCFFDILEREILRAKIDGLDVAVMMIDIDHFKSTNDTYGHQGGDEVLKQLGKILRENIYPLDVAARYGGEEFVVLMPATTAVRALQAAARLRKVIDHYPWKVGDQQICITVSIGLISVDSYNLVNGYDIVEKADAALYAAKRHGRNCVVCWDEIKLQEEPAVPENKLYHELQKKVASLSRQLQSHALGTISALTQVMDMVLKDPYLTQHGENVSTYAIAISKELGLSEELQEKIGTAALLQDIGKIAIPESILKKTTPLTEDEMNIIKQHPMTAVRILESVGIFKNHLQIIKDHHEKFDGSGYPNGLKGREISIGSRILSVADAFDAMTSERHYSPAKSIDKAFAEIQACSGSHFDPEIVDALNKAWQKHKNDWPLSAKKKSLELASQN